MPPGRCFRVDEVPRRPLARTHRPQRFAEVLGQEAPVRALASAVERGEIASAYIFSGTRGIGKTTIARIFAKALNCERGPARDCCDACTPCREITDARSLDVLELDAATHTGIDDVRELREAAQYPPNRDRYRVFILDEAHQLSNSAWNGLLKILEEPPSWCVFIFCTTEPHKIPQTIESRALHFAFRSPPPAALRQHLAAVAEKEGIEIEPEALDLLVRAADGSVRDGLSALDQARALADGPIGAGLVRDALGLIPGETIQGFIAALGQSDAASALAVIAGLDEEGQDLRAFTADVLDRVRKLAVIKALGAAGVRPEGPQTDEAAPFSIEQLVWFGRVLDETEMRLRQAAPQRTLLDLAAVRMTRMQRLADLGELIQRLGQGGGGAPPAPAPSRGSGGAAAARSGLFNGSESSSVKEGTPASPKTTQQGTPLAQLIELVRVLKPALGAYLGAATEFRLNPPEPPTLVLPAEKSFWKNQLDQKAAQEVLAEAVRQMTGQAPPSVRVVLAGNGASAAPSPRQSRAEAIEMARKDPLVRALFDRFGAMVVDGQALEPERSQES